MPRVARLDTPGLLHHVMISGIERRWIFNDNEDRENFIERLSILMPETKTQCYIKDRIKSDQRILGESDFVQDVLSESEEQFSRKHKLKSQGYDFEKLLEMVCAKFQMEKEWVIRRGKQRDRVRARDLLCYWAVGELGMSMVDVARRLDITPSAVSYSFQRGEKIAKEEDYRLEELNI